MTKLIPNLGDEYPPPSSKSLGFELIEMDLDTNTARVRFEGKPEFANPTGYVQGGYLSAMMDDVMGMLATFRLFGKAVPSTIDLHTHFLRPVRIGQIEVSARLRNIGRNVLFADAELFDARGKEAARSTASLTITRVKVPAT